MYIKNEGTIDNLRLIITEEIRVVGDLTRTFVGISPINESRESDLTFYTGEDTEIVLKTKAKIIIIGKPLGENCSLLSSTTFIVVNNPRLAFIECLNFYFPINKRMVIHPTAEISDYCKWGSNVKIGAHVTILGEVLIGNNVEICANSVIGGDGFGFQRNGAGELIKFPHFGSVIIEDDVEIGSNVCIDRGNFGATVIGRGTKIDNLVHIAHNVIVGKNCAIIAQSMVCGSVKIGDGAWLAPQSCIREGLTIGKNSVVGLGACVINDVPDNDVVVGVPARSMKK